MSRKEKPMHSFLFVSKNKKNALDYALNFLNKKNISKFDISLTEEEKQIGIGDIKKIKQIAYFKPSKGKEKAIIISAVQGLTIEAQNSLLKLLEEPPANTIIILLIESKDSVLETIQSRCKIIKINNKEEEEINEKYSKLLNSLEKAKIGEKLKIAEDLAKNKEEALKAIEKMILITRDKLLKSGDNNLIEKINKLQKAYTIIKNTNVNLRLALENLFLNF